MERSAEDLVGHLFALVDADEFDRLGEVLTDDVVYLRPGYPALEGLPALIRFYRDERIIETGRHAVEQVVGDATRAACWGRFTGTSRDGRALDERFADTYLLDDGRIRRRETFFSRPAV